MGRVILSVENCLTGSKEVRTREEGSVMGAGVGVWRRAQGHGRLVMALALNGLQALTEAHWRCLIRGLK